ncbi:MAG: class Ib ribonucleoside-diphosphate reductase assembly flavoprotein NrdI [Sodalis sp. (in: enterobacteria)]
MISLIYFSSSSANTHRFVRKLELPMQRIPIEIRERVKADGHYILILPSYGGGSAHCSIPRQVIQFLNDPFNRSLLCGVIGAGNRNFGMAFCLAAKIVAQKCLVPMLYHFELLGTTEDIAQVRMGVSKFWERQKLI